MTLFTHYLIYHLREKITNFSHSRDSGTCALLAREMGKKKLARVSDDIDVLEQRIAELTPERGVRHAYLRACFCILL